MAYCTGALRPTRLPNRSRPVASTMTPRPWGTEMVSGWITSRDGPNRTYMEPVSETPAAVAVMLALPGATPVTCTIELAAGLGRARAIAVSDDTQVNELPRATAPVGP